MRRDWVARAYAPDGRLVEAWSIKDRTEHEASNEAEADVKRLGSRVDDWTLMPA